MKFIISLVLSLSLHAQISPAPQPGQGNSQGNNYQLQFNAAYYASKPPSFQPLYTGRPGSANPNGNALDQSDRLALINRLLASGEIVDEQIDFWGVDPYTEMFDRQMQGDTWVPAGLGGTQCVTVAQYGCVVVPTTGPVPPGAIKVSTALADYPPYLVPVITAPPASNIGPQGIGPYYSVIGPVPPLGTVEAWVNPITNKPGTCTLTQIPNNFMIGGGGMMNVWNCQGGN